MYYIHFHTHAPPRAETTRILLHYGGIPFEDFVFQKEQWADLKPKMPFGQVPVLEVSAYLTEVLSVKP